MGQHAELGFCLTSITCKPLSPQSHWEERSPALCIKGANVSKGTERAGGGGEAGKYTIQVLGFGLGSSVP